MTLWLKKVNSAYFSLSFKEVSGRKPECEVYLVICSNPVTNLRSCLPVLQSLFSSGYAREKASVRC